MHDVNRPAGAGAVLVKFGDPKPIRIRLDGESEYRALTLEDARKLVIAIAELSTLARRFSGGAS